VHQTLKYVWGSGCTAARLAPGQLPAAQLLYTETVPLATANVE
jgi:hypothetical protein